MLGWLTITATLMHLSMAQIQQLQCQGCIPLPCFPTRSSSAALVTQEEFCFSHPTWHMGLLKHKQILFTYSVCHVKRPPVMVAAAAEGTFLLQGWAYDVQASLGTCS